MTATLRALVRDAAGQAGDLPATVPTAAEAEAARVLTICNACRYCEGFCAVFPAMTRRLEFPPTDVQFLAQLCHHCGACLHACQYAPPHDFAVNVPRALSQVRRQGYADFAWPAPFARLYARQGTAVALVLAAALALFLALASAGGRSGSGRGFYAVFPHGLMVSMFAPVFLFALAAIGVGVRRFWRQAPAAAAGTLRGDVLAEGLHAALTLKHLDGGHGDGCPDADDRWTHARRRLHHLTAGGFALCFASTALATVWHYAFGWTAPYPVSSAPVLLGTVGGVAMVGGAGGLAWLRRRRHPLQADPAAAPMDRGFLALLLTVGVSGLALLAGRDGAAMPTLLAVHLGTVMALFALLPYGKAVHGVYRGAALLKWAIERRQPNRVGLGGE